MSCHYAPLRHEALLHITGPQALSFLQGQTTCDTRRLDAAHALPGAYCTPQGRVVCDFLLSQLGAEHYALRLRRDIRDGSVAVLGRYIVFSRAELDAGDGQWQVAACWGDGAAERLESIFGGVPGELYGALGGDGFALVQLDTEGSRFECYLDDARGPNLREQVAAEFDPGDASTWLLQEIESGVARIEAPTVEAFVPQMLNYDLTGHISFNKGCYTGQEVVARLHYRGQSKRRMYLVRGGAAAADTPEPGTPLYNPGDERAAGTVVNAGVRPNGKIIALVVATAPGVATGLRLGAPDGPPLMPGNLPYSLPQ